MTLLLLYFFLSLIVSFLCSIAEAVLLSVPFPYLKARVEKGIDSARNMLNMKLHADKPLSAILSLNTIAHTVGAAGGGGLGEYNMDSHKQFLLSVSRKWTRTPRRKENNMRNRIFSIIIFLLF